MATVEVLPDLLVNESGSKTLGGGAGSSLAALNDASDATYVQAAGTLAQSWKAYFRFAQPSILANAAIRHVQMKMRYSHPTYNPGAASAEFMQPIAVLVGRQSGTKHVYDAFANSGAHLHLLNAGTSPTDITFSRLTKDWAGKLYLGERYQMLMNRRWYGSIQVTRNSALNLVRVYALSLLVTYDEIPTVTLSNPSGTEVTSRPPFDWVFSDPEGSPQVQVDARIYDRMMADDVDFDPENMSMWPPLYRRLITSPINHHDVVSGFGVNGGLYTAYLRAKHADVWNPGYIEFRKAAGGGDLSPLSAWASQDFSLSLAAPRPPLVTAVYDAGIHGILVEVQGEDNMLDYNDSTFEDGVGAWVAGNANTTLAQTSAQAFHGNDSLQLTRTGSTGDAVANGPTIPVQGGETYTLSAMVRTAATSRTVSILAGIANEDGALIGVFASTHSTTDVSTGWRQVVSIGTLPVDAAFIAPQVLIAGAIAGEVHYVDAVGIFPGVHSNLLTENQATIETNTTGWVAGANTTMTRVTTNFYEGMASLELTRNGSTGLAIANTLTGTSGVKVLPSQPYHASAYFKAAAVARNARVGIIWYDAAGATLTTVLSSQVLETVGEWTRISVSATSHASAAFAAIRVDVDAVPVGELHHVDAVDLGPGTSIGSFYPWNQGGFLSDDPDSHVIVLERSIEEDEHGMMLWETIPEPRILEHLPRHQILTYADYDLPSLEEVTYRAKVESMNHEDDHVNSPWSVHVMESMPAFDSWWIRDPLDPGERTMRIRVVEAETTTPKPNTSDYPVGSNAAVMTHDGVKLEEITITVDLLDEDANHMWRTMIDSGATLLLQNVHGEQWYVQADDNIRYEYLRAAKTPSEPWPVRYARRCQVTFISVEKPRALGASSHHA